MHRLLIDENVPYPCVMRLRAAGFDVTSVAETARSALDPAVMEEAAREGRILVTEDRDFGALIYAHRYPAPKGVLYVRLGNEPAAVVSDLLLGVLRSHPMLDGHFTTATPDGRLRQRPLPTQP